jgi:hypothetical protein
MWVLDHLEDLDADFLALYGIDGFESMTAPRFFGRALRTFAFSGVMAARYAAMKRDEDPVPSRVESREAKQVESTREAFSADPALGGLVSWGTNG